MMNNDPQIDQASLLPVGMLLQNGKYRVEKYLSSGNFGNTYVVTDMSTGQLRAMKEFYLRGYCYRTNMRQVTMSPAVAPERINVQREKFKKEAHRMYGLKGDHVVHIYDLFDENNTTYYVMDYVEGESLASYMEHTGKPLTEEQALYILDQVLDALSEVHAKQIWHLDLKPDNILINRQGKVVLIDFGASKQIGASGKYTGTTGVLCYTPGFAPLEQMSQDMASIGPWTDIYALGATLYNLLTNITPTMQSPETLRYPYPVSKKTRDLIAWMMSIERQKRPQSIAAIRGYLNYNSAQRQQHPPIKQTAINQNINLNGDDNDEDDEERRSTKRKWIIAGSVGGGLIALLLIILLATSGGNRDNDGYDWSSDEWESADAAVEEAEEVSDYDYEELARQEKEAMEQAYRDSIEYMRQLEEQALAEAEQARIEAEERAAEAEERAAQAERERQAAQQRQEQSASAKSVKFTKAYLEHNVPDANGNKQLKGHYSFDISGYQGHNVYVYMYIYESDGTFHKGTDGKDLRTWSTKLYCNWDRTTFTDGSLAFYNSALNPKYGTNDYYAQFWVYDADTDQWIGSSDKMTYSHTGN